MNAEQGKIGSRMVRLAAVAVLGTGDGHLVLAIVCCEDIVGGGAVSAFARTAAEGEAPHAGVVAEQGVGLEPVTALKTFILDLTMPTTIRSLSIARLVTKSRASANTLCI